MRLFLVGLALTGLVSAILWLIWGTPALVPGITFGLLATAIQLVAVTLAKRTMGGPFSKFMGRWAIGMGLRFSGVVLFAGAVVSNRELFAPLPTAFAYVGVLLPLLYAETWFLR